MSFSTLKKAVACYLSASVLLFSGSQAAVIANPSICSCSSIPGPAPLPALKPFVHRNVRRRACEKSPEDLMGYMECFRAGCWNSNGEVTDESPTLDVEFKRRSNEEPTHMPSCTPSVHHLPDSDPDPAPEADEVILDDIRREFRDMLQGIKGLSSDFKGATAYKAAVETGIPRPVAVTFAPAVEIEKRTVINPTPTQYNVDAFLQARDSLVDDAADALMAGLRQRQESDEELATKQMIDGILKGIQYDFLCKLKDHEAIALRKGLANPTLWTSTPEVCLETNPSAESPSARQHHPKNNDDIQNLRKRFEFDSELDAIYQYYEPVAMSTDSDLWFQDFYNTVAQVFLDNGMGKTQFISYVQGRPLPGVANGWTLTHQQGIPILSREPRKLRERHAFPSELDGIY